jgi:hypothetical protein
MEIEKTKVRRCPYCKVRSAYGRHLEFISWIHRDGGGTTSMLGKEHAHGETLFTLLPLSLNEGTFIASEFNSYVVRLK